MKIKLSYMLSNRKLSLETYCKRQQIETYEQLSGILFDAGVQCPIKSEIPMFNKEKAAPIGSVKTEEAQTEEAQTEEAPHIATPLFIADIDFHANDVMVTGDTHETKLKKSSKRTTRSRHTGKKTRSLRKK